jgi:hypothetical protein
MRLPYWSLTTLMIAVAVVGVDLALLVSVPGPIVIILPYGPLVGIVWAFYRLRGRRYAYLRGGLRGGVFQGVLITLFTVGFLVSERASGIDRAGNEWSTIALDLWSLPLASLVIGMAIGLFAELGYLLHWSRILPF